MARIMVPINVPSSIKNFSFLFPNLQSKCNGCQKKVTHKIQYNGVCEDNIERRYYESPQASYTRRKRKDIKISLNGLFS